MIYRQEPILIQNAIRCLVSDRFHGTCVDFIRQDLGEAAALLRQSGLQAPVGSR